MKILKIIIRLNQTGVSITDINNPLFLLSILKFNPQDIKLEELIHEKIKHRKYSQGDEQKRLLKKLRRIEGRLTSTIDSEKLEFPNFYKHLTLAIENLDTGNFEEFRKLFCTLNVKEWKPDSKNIKIFDGIRTSIENIQKKYCKTKPEL